MSDKITKEDAQKWANALRSGKYVQGKRHLQYEDGFCCLGVACKLFIPKTLLRISKSGHIAGDYPKEQLNSPAWLKKVDYDFRDRVGDTLSELNDQYNYTFDEIADLIELVYVHEAL